MGIFQVVFSFFVLSFLITGFMALLFNSKGPWGSYWSVFLIIFLFIWAASLWLNPVGPNYLGVSWAPALFVGILIAVLLTAVTPRTRRTKSELRIENYNLEDRNEGTALALDIFFWMVIGILGITILITYFY